MALKGIPLSTYTEELHHIPKGILPTRTIQRFEERLLPFAEELAYRARDYKVFDPAKCCHALPLAFYETCSFEELAKIWAVHFICMPRQIDKLFEELPEYRIINKLRNSMWRWGCGHAEEEWNHLVDAYNGIRNFSFGLPGFTVTLDHTTGYNEFGYGEHDYGTYLDGVFGFRVHYEGKHVLTIGFSVARGGRLLLAQIQLKHAKGNRFLYKLPTHHVQYVVELMKRSFPTFRQYMTDGSMSVEKYLADFRSGLERILKSRRDCSSPEREKWMEDQITTYREHIQGLEGEVGERIKKTYQLESGPYRLSTYRPFSDHKMRFFRIISA